MRKKTGQRRLSKLYQAGLSILIAVTVTWLVACSNGGWVDRNLVHDSGPDRHVDVSHIPDAVPRVEPLSRGGNPVSYVIDGKRYYPMKSSTGYNERGIASWYGNKFHGRKTSNGETYDMYAMTAAHKTLPLPTYARVTNLRNGNTIVVRVNDRGPFHDNRVIDLSYAGAAKLGMLAQGTAPVEVIAIDPRQPAKPATPEPVLREAEAEADVRMYLQLGAFSDFSNAERLQTRLQPHTGEALRIAASTVDNGLVYRVRLGPLASVEEADRWTARLIELGVEPPRLVIESL